MKTKKIKKKSSTFYRKKCVTWAKLEARKRDGDICQHCGKSKASGWVIHGSHILPEGAYPLMSSEPYNIIALCAICHMGGYSSWGIGIAKVPSWHGDPMYFSGWFEKKWPGRYKELREMAEEKRTHVVNWEARWNEIKNQPP